MDAIFTIPYGEYVVADILAKKLPGISIFIPSSRQEKGIDLLLYKFDVESKTTTIQVKQSKTYFKKELIKFSDTKVPVVGGLWFNRFEIPSNADWILLTGVRAIHPQKWLKSGIKDIIWEPIILAFTNAEMVEFMENVRQRKNPERYDRMFGFDYDDNNIYQTRGCLENRKMNDYFLDNRINEILSSMK